MKKFIRESWLVIVLGIAIAAALGAAQAGLDPYIKQNQRTGLEKAIFEVVPGARTYERRTLDLQEVYKCLGAAGELAGWAIPGSGFGFQDKITLVAGLSADGTRITGLTVLENKETPGLGNIIEKPQWRSQYAGLDATTLVRVIKGQRQDPLHEVEAITGATISSNAVTRILNEAVARVRPRLNELK